MLTSITIVICCGILVSGFLAVMLDSMVSAIISAGLSGLFASATYIIMAAPDVAMTEAAIGSGLTTMIFFYAVHKTQLTDKQDD